MTEKVERGTGRIKGDRQEGDKDCVIRMGEFGNLLGVARCAPYLHEQYTSEQGKPVVAQRKTEKVQVET